MTRVRIDEFVERFASFHELGQTDQILRLIYFHAIEERRDSVSRGELEDLFKFAELPVPKNLAQLLSYLAGRGGKLINSNGEFSLVRDVRKAIQAELGAVPTSYQPQISNGVGPFDFANRTFNDLKIATLLNEAKKCHGAQCWNACGILMRIIIERVLDTLGSVIKQKIGLKDKINAAKGMNTLSKSLREALDHLHNAKILGDIAAHHSKILLEQNDIDLVIPPMRILLKEMNTV